MDIDSTRSSSLRVQWSYRRGVSFYEFARLPPSSLLMPPLPAYKICESSLLRTRSLSVSTKNNSKNTNGWEYKVVKFPTSRFKLSHMKTSESINQSIIVFKMTLAK